MAAAPPLDIHVRSYGEDRGPESHGFAQLVLPLSGMLTMDIAGCEGQLGSGRAAFVAAGERHSQMSDIANRSLIVDLDDDLVDPALFDRLARQPIVPIAPAATKLVDYMGLVAHGGAVANDTLRLWLPLVLGSLASEQAAPPSRLAALLAAIEAEPGKPWTTAAMADRAAMSVSRLHAAFRSQFDTTPHGWLAEMRLRQVTHWLGQSNRPIAEIAFRLGYADQSAPTRAMRKAIGLTPAAYRRQMRETGPKKR